MIMFMTMMTAIMTEKTVTTAISNDFLDCVVDDDHDQHDHSMDEDQEWDIDTADDGQALCPASVMTIAAVIMVIRMVGVNCVVVHACRTLSH